MAGSDQNKSEAKAKAKAKTKAKTKKNEPGFFKGVSLEFKKISWPSREAILKESAAAVVVTIVLGIIISVLDLIIQYGVNFLTLIG